MELILIVLAIGIIALPLYATSEVLQNPEPLDTTRLLWLLIIWTVPLAGPVLWLMAGKRVPIPNFD